MVGLLLLAGLVTPFTVPARVAQAAPVSRPVQASLGDAVSLDTCVNHGGWKDCEATFEAAHTVVAWVVRGSANGSGATAYGLIGDGITIGCGSGSNCAFENGGTGAALPSGHALDTYYCVYEEHPSACSAAGVLGSYTSVQGDLNPAGASGNILVRMRFFPWAGVSGTPTATAWPIYDVAPTATPGPTPTPGAPVTGSLVAYWKLDEASGTRLDSLNGCGGSGCDLSDNNTVTSATGKVGTAAEFTAANSEYLSHADHADLSTGNINFTIAGWVYLTNNSANRMIVSKWGGSNEYELGYFSSSNRFGFQVEGPGPSGGGVLANNLGAPSLNTWYFVLAWHDATNDLIGIQVNHGTPNTTGFSAGVNDTSTAFAIGRRGNDNGGYLNGRIDEVGFWKRLLTDDEKDCLWNDGDGNTYPFTSCVPPAEGPPSSTGNRLRDGDMELQQAWLYWQIEGGWPHGRYVGNILADVYFGTRAACGNGYEVIGGSLFGSLGTANPRSIRQNFQWEGGTLYVSYSARGDRFSGTGGSQLDAKVRNLSTGVDYVLDADQFYPASGWTTVQRTVPALPAGTYEILFEPSASTLAADDYIVIDDVWVDQFWSSACAQPPPPPTPTGTATPTPTVTSTRTPTPTGTWSSPTPGPSATAANQPFFNCDFERGAVGWFGNNYSIALAGGPIGPQYAHLPNSAGIIGQTVSWSTSDVAWVTFWVGPGSYGEVRFQPAAGGLPLSVWVGQNITNDWQRIQRSRYLPAGSYYIQAVAYNQFRWDGVSIGRNGYTICGGGTPTPGPTAYVTGTPTRTPTTGPSPTRTNTAVPSHTNTPNPTSTAQPTYTPRPSSTPAPTHTQTDPEKTATAQGTDVATYTPVPSTTPGGGGQPPEGCDNNRDDCPVPEQPAPAPGADCVRPQQFWQVAQWVDYTRCEVLKYFAWAPQNTEQLQELGEQVQEREPFGSVGEVVESVEAVQFIISEYDWTNTGYTGVFDWPRRDAIALARGFLSGAVSFTASPGVQALIHAEINFCKARLTTIFSNNVVNGVCIVWAWSHYWGITAWTQWFFDLAVWIAFIRFVIKTFLG